MRGFDAEKNVNVVFNSTYSNWGCTESSRGSAEIVVNSFQELVSQPWLAIFGAEYNVDVEADVRGGHIVILIDSATLKGRIFMCLFPGVCDIGNFVPRPYAVILRISPAE